MIKPKLWEGQDLKGVWEVTIKIDGVRALIKDGVVTSRNGKPLHNLNGTPDGDYEIYCGDWESTITAVKTKGLGLVPPEHIYSIDPIDDRLRQLSIIDPTAEHIDLLLLIVNADGHEGLVLRQGKNWLKVKPFETYDVRITGFKMGKGRNTGRLGAFLTDMGNVGGGLTDVQREEFLEVPIGTYIEVKCWELTKAGKFRHPRFKRIRWDK